MTTTDLAGLIAKLESASEGSLALDRAINATRAKPYVHLPVPHWTCSLDAALTLVPEGWNWHGAYWAANLGDAEGGPWTRICITRGSLYSWEWVERAGDGHTGTARTPALALCIAALKARSQS